MRGNQRGSSVDAIRREQILQDEKDGSPVKRLKEHHHKMVDWMLTHYTGKNLSEMARTFGYSQSWISQLINSDIFQAELAQRRAGVNDEHRMRIVQKTMNVAERALDKLDELLQDEDEDLDPRLILDSADKMMHRLGFAPQAQRNNIENQQNNYFLVDQEVAAAARERLQNRALEGQTFYADKES